MTNILSVKKLSLKSKLMLSYAVPLCLILIILALIIYPKYYRSYKYNQELMQNQSYVQTVNYIYQYFTTMSYLLNSMEQDDTICEELSNINSEKNMGYDNQYRVFWNLKNIIDLRTITNLKYRIGFYLSQDFVFSNNNVNFFSYERFVAQYPFQKLKLDCNKMVYALMEEKKLTTEDNSKEVYLALLKKYNEDDVIIKVEVPIYDIKKILDQSALTKNTEVFLINEDDHIIISYDNEKMPENNNEFHVMTYDIQGFAWKIVSYTPITEYKWIYESAIFIFVIIMTLLLGVIIITSYILSFLITQRLAGLSLNMELVSNGEYDVPDISNIDYNQCDEIGKIDYQFNQMATKLRFLMEEQYRLGKKEASSELKALQSQINPHFLYNTLDLINWQALKTKDLGVAKIARDLGMFYRLALNHGKAAVSIKDELRHVQTYVDIENQHFDNNIHLEILVPQIIQAYACLGLILQPIVENSIVHGIASNPDTKDCVITIGAELIDQGKYISFEIRDNGKGMDEDTLQKLSNGEIKHSKENGYGINNIRTRLSLCYEKDYMFYYKSKFNKGTTCYIVIPALTLEQLEARLQ